MRAQDFAETVRERLRATGQSRHGAAVAHDLPRDAIRRALEGHIPRLDRAAEICHALGLELYIGPPRATGAVGTVSGAGPGSKSGAGAADEPGAVGLSGGALRGLEASARTLNRVVADAGGDPVPDDLWPVLAARRGGPATAAENDNLPPGARPVDVVELAAAAGGGSEALGEEVAGCVWFRQDWLDRRNLDPTQCVVIRVSGESMEPLLQEGDSILVDRKRRRRIQDRIFVVRTDDGLVVKRAGRDEDGGWLLLSEHPSWEPAPWPANAETIGQAVWTARSLV